MANVSRNRRTLLSRGKTYVLRTTEKGVIAVAPGYAAGTQRLAGDPMGVSTLSVDGILLGSEVRLFTADGTEIQGGVESSVSSSMVFNYSFYSSPRQGFLVVIKPGYRLLRIPFQLYKTVLSYSVLQTLDPAYIPD
jgi:hypothetical protein